MGKHSSRPDPDSDEKEIPPGPTDQGREGGMATREVAPEVAENPE
jgi:hypothetical protein